MNRTLYAKDVSGGIRVWSIMTFDRGIEIEYGQLGGSLQRKTENIDIGKASRTLEEQIHSRYYSRINAQYDKGYCDTRIEAETKSRTNSIGLLRPMLAKPIKGVKVDYSNAYYQHKYDGNRCMITKKDGKLIAYSRNGKTINSIYHILDNIELEEGQTVDGELYCHGVPLQTICSWIKREQDATKSIVYRMYDIMIDAPYHKRLECIRDISIGAHIEVVPTSIVKDSDSVSLLLQSSLKGGYEGGILRWGSNGYEDGKRSKSLLKIKVFEDDEFEVIDIERSKDGWARLTLLAKNGKEFKVSAPGTMNEKFNIANNYLEYIGLYVNVKYANLTKDGIPFHPVATMFRNKDEE